MSEPMPPEWFSATRAAAWLGIDYNRFVEMVQTGNFPRGRRIDDREMVWNMADLQFMVFRLAENERFQGPAPTGPAATSSGAAQLREVEAAALNASPKYGAQPISMKQLARLAGYKDTGHFREAVRVLVDRGLLVRVRDGLRQPS